MSMSVSLHFPSLSSPDQRVTIQKTAFCSAEQPPAAPAWQTQALLQEKSIVAEAILYPNNPDPAFLYIHSHATVYSSRSPKSFSKINPGD